MISDEEIYVVKGKELKTMINLLYDLRYVAVEYAKFNKTEVEETETFYTNFIENIVQSKLFKDLKYGNLSKILFITGILLKLG